MLSFAIDPQADGNFQPFASWVGGGISWSTISEDRKVHPQRSYLISLGGAAAYGGTFQIKAGMSVDQWVANAASSVTSIINQYGAQGAEIQFEGGTNHPSFTEANDKLLKALKDKNLVTAIGPYYGHLIGWGTARDYAKLNPANIDAVNMQMYADGCDSASCMGTYTTDAISQTPGGAAKFVYGLSSGKRTPSPPVGLNYLKTLATRTPRVLGMFSWDAEDDVVMKPAYCLENLGSQILAGGDPDVSGCSW